MSLGRALGWRPAARRRRRPPRSVRAMILQCKLRKSLSALVGIAEFSKWQP